MSFEEWTEQDDAKKQRYQDYVNDESSFNES